MHLKYLRLLSERNFFLLWLGQIISQFGDRLTQIALVALVSQGMVSQGALSSSRLAFVMSMAIIPVFIISPISGVYIDRWDKRKTMYISDFIRGIFILMIPIFFTQIKSMPIVYVLLFLSFSAGRFFIPAKMAFIPEIAKKEDLFLANSLISITATIAAVLGMGLGGIIAERYGVATAFHLDAVTFFASALAVIFIARGVKGAFAAKDILGIGRSVVANVRKSFVWEFKEGIKYILKADETKYAFKVFLFLFFYIGGLYVVFIRFVQETLGTITKDLGFMAVSLGFSIFIGSLVYGRFAHKVSVKRVINVSMLLASAYIVFFAAALKAYPTPLYGVLLSFILGFIISPVFVGVNALIHKESDHNLLGRIFSGLEFTSHLGFLISMFISSFLADIFSPFTIVISIGIIGFIFSAFSIFKK